VGGKDVDLAPEGFDDELNVFSRNTLDGLLNYMIAILVLDALENVGLELFNKFRLLICEDMFQSLEDVSKVLSNYGSSLRTFCTTRQPYICIDNSITWFFICSVRTRFWTWLPCSNCSRQLVNTRN
jgi:hypothetical protein